MQSRGFVQHHRLANGWAKYDGEYSVTGQALTECLECFSSIDWSNFGDHFVFCSKLDEAMTKTWTYGIQEDWQIEQAWCSASLCVPDAATAGKSRRRSWVRSSLGCLRVTSYIHAGHPWPLGVCHHKDFSAYQLFFQRPPSVLCKLGPGLSNPDVYCVNSCNLCV